MSADELRVPSERTDIEFQGEKKTPEERLRAHTRSIQQNKNIPPTQKLIILARDFWSFNKRHNYLPSIIPATMIAGAAITLGTDVTSLFTDTGTDMASNGPNPPTNG